MEKRRWERRRRTRTFMKPLSWIEVWSRRGFVRGLFCKGGSFTRKWSWSRGITAISILMLCVSARVPARRNRAPAGSLHRRAIMLLESRRKLPASQGWGLSRWGHKHERERRKQRGLCFRNIAVQNRAMKAAAMALSDPRHWRYSSSWRRRSNRSPPGDGWWISSIPSSHLRRVLLTVTEPQERRPVVLVPRTTRRISRGKWIRPKHHRHVPLLHHYRGHAWLSTLPQPKNEMGLGGLFGSILSTWSSMNIASINASMRKKDQEEGETVPDWCLFRYWRRRQSGGGRSREELLKTARQVAS